MPRKKTDVSDEVLKHQRSLLKNGVLVVHKRCGTRFYRAKNSVGKPERCAVCLVFEEFEVVK